MQVMATQAIYLLFCPGINNIGPQGVGHLVGRLMTTGTQLGTPRFQELRIVRPVGLMTLHTVDSGMGHHGSLVLDLVEMASHAQISLLPDQERLGVGGVWIVAMQTRLPAVQIMMIGQGLEGSDRTVALQARILIGPGQVKGSCRFELIVTLAAVPGRKRVVLVFSQQTRRAGSMGIMTSRAVRIQNGTPAMGSGKFRARIVARETKTRHGLGNEALESRAVNAVASHTHPFVHRIMNNRLSRPFFHADMATGAKLNQGTDKLVVLDGSMRIVALGAVSIDDRSMGKSLTGFSLDRLVAGPA